MLVAIADSMAVSTKILAVVVIAVLVVAGVGLYFVLNDDDDDDKEAATTGRLQVYGNADNNDVIDDEDLNAIDNFKESWDKEKYPYADANRDGVIDDKDKEIIQKLINREPCDVTYIDGTGEEKTCSFPIDRFVIAGTMVHPVINALGISDHAVGKTGKSSSLDPVLDAPTYNLPQAGPKAYSVDLEQISKLGKVDAVFTLYSSTYDKVETALEGSGISCVRINPESTDYSLKAYLLVGFLTNAMDRSKIIVDFYDKWNEDIADKVASISDADRKTGFAAYTYSMCGTDYYLTENLVAAGVTNLSDFNDQNTKRLKDNNEWALVDKYQGDYIFQFSGWGMRWDENTSATDEYDYYGKYFTGFDAYKEHNYYTINKTVNDIGRVAFIASIVYPEVFGEDYGYQVYGELIETFYPYVTDFDVHHDGKWVISYDDAHPSS